LAEQDALLPPLLPEHVQRYGPEPLTPDALPTLHRADVDGALYTLLPFAVPHTALTAVTQVPPEPLHEPWLQLKVRLPRVGRPLSVRDWLSPWVSVEAVALQEEPLMAQDKPPPTQLRLDAHDAFAPPLLPEQVHE
jgi:hypothetical protein